MRRYLLDGVVRLLGVGETLGGGDGLSCARIILEASVDEGSSRNHDFPKDFWKGKKAAHRRVGHFLEYLDVTGSETLGRVGRVEGLAGQVARWAAKVSEWTNHGL
jgi:hypothetical protein